MLRFRVRSYSYITEPTTAPRASRRSPPPHVNQHVASQHGLPGHPVPWIRGDHRGRLAVDSSCPPRCYPPYHPQIERGGTGHYRSEWRCVRVQCRRERDQAVDRGSLLVGIADRRQLSCEYIPPCQCQDRVDSGNHRPPPALPRVGQPQQWPDKLHRQSAAIR